MEKKIGFLMLPGGGMSAWVWRDLKPLLKADILAPEYRLPENSLENREKASIIDCVNYNIELINQAGFSKVVVVGHSGAGALAAAIAKEIPGQIAHVVYISANIPKNHKSALDSLPFLLRMLNAKAIRTQIKNDSTPVAKMEKIVRKVFCNTMNAETINYFLTQKLLSEPLCLAFERYNWDNYPEINQTYIILTSDKTHKVQKQKAMMMNLNVQNSVEINSDHMVMLSHPKELAKALNTILDECT